MCHIDLLFDLFELKECIEIILKEHPEKEEINLNKVDVEQIWSQL